MIELEKLKKMAEKAMNYAYAPYSEFPVGAAIQTHDGEFFSGCNVENACYAMGHCAEVSALGAMVSGGKRSIQAVVIFSKSDKPISPCGGCLQKLAEFARDDTVVYSFNTHGKQQKWALQDLFPYHFNDDMLKT